MPRLFVPVQITNESDLENHGHSLGMHSSLVSTSYGLFGHRDAFLLNIGLGSKRLFIILNH